MSLNVWGHVLVAVAVTVTLTLVTGWPILGWAVGGLIYPIREYRQYRKGKGAGVAAAVVPFVASTLVAYGLSLSPHFLEKLL